MNFILTAVLVLGGIALVAAPCCLVQTAEVAVILVVQEWLTPW